MQWLFVPSQRFAFCWMHKVSCTNFKALLHAAAPLLDKGAREAQRTAYRNINTIFNDPSWTKAVFYREPLGRFLSGWLDKCNDVSRVYCVHVFGDMNVSFRDAVLSLAHGCNRARSFVHAPPPAPVRRWVEGDGDDPDDLDDDHLGRPQLQPCLTRKTGAVAGWGERHTMDGHFRQQTDFCGGLGAALGGYQVVQQLELSTSRERVAAYVKKRTNAATCPLSFAAAAFVFHTHQTEGRPQGQRWRETCKKYPLFSSHIGGQDAGAQQYHRGPQQGV